MRYENGNEGMDIYNFNGDYSQIIITPRMGNYNGEEVEEVNEKKEGFTRHSDVFVGYDKGFQRTIVNSGCKWFKCHWSGKIVGSVLQTFVIGDLVSDLIFIRDVIEYKDGWWFFISILILYLSLRFTLFFTLMFEKDFFGVRDSKGRMGKVVFYLWTKLHKVYKYDARDFNLRVYLVFYFPGLFYIVGIGRAALDELELSSMYKILSSSLKCIGTLILFVIGIVIIEGIIIPICVIVISPITLLGHVIKGINGVWNTKSVSFYENSFDVQTYIFYATVALLFETLTESVPQFLLQTWIYYHSHDLIPESTYYTSVGFSLFDIVNAIVIYIISRKQLEFSLTRLAYNPSGSIECKDDYKKLYLPRWSAELIIQLVQEISEVQDLDVSRARKFTNDTVTVMVEHLRLLRCLNISGTNISDEGIHCLAKNCKQLNTLLLQGTNVSDEGVIIIAGNCPLLETLSLGNMKITDEGIKAIAANCRLLETLAIENTKITDEGIKLIAKNCKQMKSFNLEDTSISDEGLTIIAENCRLLDTLELENTNITDVGLIALGEYCNHLNTLNLRNTNVNDKGIKSIANKCDQLKFLDLQRTNISDKGLKEIAENCHLLDTLNLCYTNISDEGVTNIAESCHLLDTLALGNTKITDEGIRVIAKNCKQLRSFNLQETSITDDSLITIAENCHLLDTLDLENTKITDKGIKAIAKSCKQLESLILRNVNISDEGIKAITKSCKQLRSLNLQGTNITNDSLLTLADKCHLLDTLELGNTMITEWGITSVARCPWKQWKSFNLQGTNISDEGLTFIADNFGLLDTLVLGNTTISDEGLKAIAENCTRLKIFDLQNTSITDGGLTTIAEKCLELESINLMGHNVKVTDLSVSLLLRNCTQLRDLGLPSSLEDYRWKYSDKYPLIRIK